MDINKITLKVLEWDNILTELSRYSSCETGKERCKNAEIFSDVYRIKTELKLTSEAKYLLDKSQSLAGLKYCKTLRYISNS